MGKITRHDATGRICQRQNIMFYILINMNSHHQYLILLIFLSKQYASRLTCLVGTFVVKQNLERPKRTNEEVKHLVEKILVPLVGFVDAGQLVRV